jgi:DNA-binding IclR family transcriptional regulator
MKDGKPGQARGGVNSVARAIEILKALSNAADGELTLAEIAARTDLPTSTVHRIVQTLREEQLVASVGGAGGLRLGPGLARLAAISRSRLVPMVRPFLEQLSHTLDQGASLAVLDGGEVRFLDQAIASHGLRAVSLVGSVFPAHCTANGKALLAALPEQVLEATLPRRLQKLTPNTITGRAKLLEELARVRERGIAFDREEHAVGISAAGVTIHDAVGNLAAITVAMSTAAFGEREGEAAAELTRTAERVDAALAFAGDGADGHATTTTRR